MACLVRDEKTLVRADPTFTANFAAGQTGTRRAMAVFSGFRHFGAKMANRREGCDTARAACVCLVVRLFRHDTASWGVMWRAGKFDKL